MVGSRRRREVDCPDITTEGQELVPAQASSASTTSLTAAQQHHINSGIEAIAHAITGVNILDALSENNQMILEHFKVLAYQYYRTRTPQLTLLPSLSQFNFLRALLANVEVLNLSSEQMSDEAFSPFNTLDSYEAQPQASGTTSHSLISISQLPAGLQPTCLQRATLHHPWIDLIPIPEMRDNMFRRGLESFDEDQLCHDMRGYIPGRNPGILVWRDPWDSSGWEVTEAFAKSWGWVIAGCWDLLNSTNRWRAQRGEGPLFRILS